VVARQRAGHELWRAGRSVAKLTLPAEAAASLGVRERVLLFCAASGTSWQQTRLTDETVTNLVEKGLISRDAPGAIALTDRGRAVFRAMLLDL
jgi:hypothetical protein